MLSRRTSTSVVDANIPVEEEPEDIDAEAFGDDLVKLLQGIQEDMQDMQDMKDNASEASTTDTLDMLNFPGALSDEDEDSSPSSTSCSRRMDCMSELPPPHVIWANAGEDAQSAKPTGKRMDCMRELPPLHVIFANDSEEDIRRIFDHWCEAKVQELLASIRAYRAEL